VSGDSGVVIDLLGPLCVRDGIGAELTPKGRKAQGLIALLATAPGLKRSRAWLQDKLWSDRGPEQGAASLRQCLTEIRLALGPHVDVLRAELGWVGFDPARTTVREVPPTGPPGLIFEFLEGLDIRDAEFENWLRDQRLAREGVQAAPPAAREGLRAPPPRPVLIVGPIDSARDDLRVFAAALAEGIGARIAHAGNVLIAERLPEGLDRAPLGARVAVRAAEMGRTLYLQVRLIELRSGTIFWIGLREIDPSAAREHFEGAVSQFANEVAAVAVDELGRMAENADDNDRIALLGYQALRHTILLDPDEQRAADRMLEAAFEAHGSAVFLAQRALLRVVQIFERVAPDEKTTREEAIAFMRQAQALQLSNPIITAAAARVAVMLEDKIQGGLELARKAVAQGPATPQTWDILATALYRTGRAAEAHEAALRARLLAAGLPQTYFWDALCCITAMVAGRFDEATHFGEVARDLAPTFKPPLRYLAALYYHQGRHDEAAKHLQMLKELEGDFSLKDWEESYPVAALRQTPLIAIARSRLI
jgi:tetratricopeptide (TPR) repeat protein